MKLKNILFKSEEENPNADVVSELKDLKVQLDNAYTQFQYQTDGDLLDACIYEIQALRSKYGYLLKIAKEKNIHSGEVVFGAYSKVE